MKLPDDIPEEIREQIESGEAEVVAGGDATDLLQFALQQVPAEVATQMLVTQIALMRAEHVVHSDCDCTPDDAWYGGFEIWDEIIEEVKAQVKPMYDEYIEAHIFAVDVQDDLESLEVAEPVRPGDGE